MPLGIPVRQEEFRFTTKAEYRVLHVPVIGMGRASRPIEGDAAYIEPQGQIPVHRPTHGELGPEAGVVGLCTTIGIGCAVQCARGGANDDAQPEMGCLGSQRHA